MLVQIQGYPLDFYYAYVVLHVNLHSLVLPHHNYDYLHSAKSDPIGYMSSFENYIKTKRPELSFDDYWKKDSKNEVYHFIGKDIVYFHALFWPAMLEGANYRTPTGLFVNSFLPFGLTLPFKR